MQCLKLLSFSDVVLTFRQYHFDVSDTAICSRPVFLPRTQRRPREVYLAQISLTVCDLVQKANGSATVVAYMLAD